jgi:hypothetical protein
MNRAPIFEFLVAPESHDVKVKEHVKSCTVKHFRFVTSNSWNFAKKIKKLVESIKYNSIKNQDFQIELKVHGQALKERF